MRLAFVHIPKCAGTSFENYIQSHLHACDPVPICFTGEGPDGSRQTFEQYARSNRSSPFLYGHVPLALYLAHCVDLMPVTFLRDPVARTVSHYRSWHDPRNFNPGSAHFRVADRETKQALAFSQRATLEEFVETSIPYVREAIDNPQTRMLSTCGVAPMEDQLQSAMRILESMIFFGITERFAESIEHFRRVFVDASPYALDASRENRSRMPMGAVSAATVETIRALNAFDVRLYEHGLSLFEARLADAHRPRFTLASILAAARTPELVDGLTRRIEALDVEVSKAQTDNQTLRAKLEELRNAYTNLATVQGHIVTSSDWRVARVIHRATRFLRRR